MSERPGWDGAPADVDLGRVWTGVAAQVWRRQPGWTERLAGRLLRPLIERGRGSVRLLLGSRRHACGHLGPAWPGSWQSSSRC